MNPRRFTFAKWALLGGVLSTLLTLVVMVLVYRDPVPRLTRSSFDDARERWQAAGLLDYDLKVEAVSAAIDVYQISVREGAVAQVIRNGEVSSRPASFQAWTVGGMFDVISSDLQSQEAITRDQAPPGAAILSLRAEFDAKSGIPLRYLRADRSAGRTSRWTVQSWSRAEPGTPFPAAAADTL
ncbi:DUF6174 domain-containing protein [Lignipirellula cremea]|uniref:Uncharacterized protein n=1 Tax=Lignipirellula cremea TaxID=2528010 RepID=A0A518DY63_9BACT|nr:DUF6174 domain-containing protein [Lignipirellula cremea]QDU96789.1 hypothetical protein Pla8534_46100 [Lignipirellula cremea]